MAQMDRFFLGQSAQKEPVPMGKMAQKEPVHLCQKEKNIWKEPKQDQLW